MDFYIGYIISGIIILIAIIVSLVMEVKVNSAYDKYRNVGSSLDLTGAELAEKMAQESGINIVVRKCNGKLTDHYNPKDKSLNISESNFNSKSISAQSVVAHEFGHALQDANEYAPLKIRQTVIKISNFVSGLLIPLLLIGVLLQLFWIAGAGSIIIYVSVGIYAISVIASLVTLPVEFNASSRAKKILYQMGCTSDEEVRGTDKVLNAAAMTYVASLFVSLAYFLRFLMLLLAMRDN